MMRITLDEAIEEVQYLLEHEEKPTRGFLEMLLVLLKEDVKCR